MAVGQRVLITIVGEYFGQTTMTTFLYRVSESSTPITDFDFFDALDTVVKGAGGLVTLYRNCTPLDLWQGRYVWYQVLGPTRFRKVAFELNDDGLFDYGTHSANLQASITRVGALGSRKDTGGIRIPIATTAGVEGKINEDLKAVMNILALEMTENITASGTTIKPQVGVPGYTNTDPPVQRPVTESRDLEAAIVQDTVRVLRRRTLHLGI